MYRKLIFFMGLVLSCHIGFTQNKTIDVQHYRFQLALNDTTNVIQGEATITFVNKDKDNRVYFYLIGPNESATKGMQVSRVLTNQQNLTFTQHNNRVYIKFPEALHKGDTAQVTISYSGVPADGLIISHNKFGQRTFFTDNWPQRARYWLPSNDHPSDKATMEFIVIAPEHYEVIGSGVKVAEKKLSEHKELTHWVMNTPIPTKVMAIGVADFAVDTAGVVNGIPVQTWVFAQNKKQGFKQYAVATRILPFFMDYIGPFPYKKLANVQSKTKFGGMENASNIFYNQNTVTLPPTPKSQYELETLMAHEIAHQWFGDAVSETDWPHLWLSEGFATYFTNLYVEYQYGEQKLDKRLRRQRQTIIAFSKKRHTPVVDTTAAENLLQLLNPYSYQKGGWVLHMLRQKVGDTAFQKGIRLYYATYRNKNASTADFKEIMEQVSQQNLNQFFKQWLHKPGHPIVKVTWQYKNGQINLQITQQQNRPFHFPLEIAFKIGADTVFKTFQIDEAEESFSFSLSEKPQNIVLDPHVNLLFEGTVVY